MSQIIFNFSVIFFYIFCVLLVVTTLFFNKYYFVLQVLPTGSMKPYIDHESLVIAKKHNGLTIPKNDSVIIYRDIEQKVNIIHRMHGYYVFENKTFIIAKGDANKYYDRPFPLERVYGVVVVKI